MARTFRTRQERIDEIDKKIEYYDQMKSKLLEKKEKILNSNPSNNEAKIILDTLKENNLTVSDLLSLIASK